VLVGLIALPGAPVPVMFTLLFVGGLLAPPFEAARSAQLPRILTGARYPLGVAIGGLILTRLPRPRTRTRLIRPLAVLAPLTLAPALFNPPLAGALLLITASGVVMSLLLPAAQTLFQRTLAHEYRARAFGVMNGGIQIAQGAAVLATGALAERLPTATVIGAWCAAGTLLMLLLALRPITGPGAPAVSSVPAKETI
jgi:hypothetical protein